MSPGKPACLIWGVWLTRALPGSGRESRPATLVLGRKIFRLRPEEDSARSGVKSTDREALDGTSQYSPRGISTPHGIESLFNLTRPSPKILSKGNKIYLPPLRV
jgi:hypothetical protein